VICAIADGYRIVLRTTRGTNRYFYAPPGLGWNGFTEVSREEFDRGLKESRFPNVYRYLNNQASDCQ
jgi:hypothetical protein